MNFDDLVSIINNIKDQKGEECMICMFPITDDSTLLKLSCNHFYHTSCLAKKNDAYTCPYCHKTTNIVVPKNIVPLNINTCKSIIKSGANKGNVCGKINCNRHKLIKTNDLCKATLKSGVDKGKPCGKLNCKRHNKVLNA